MKRTILITAAATLAVSLAFAYGPRFQNAPAAPAGAAGYGAGPMQAGAVFAGTLHDEAAAILGITPDELVALHQDGKTLSDIAVELGQDADAFKTALVDARNQAIDEAVANGELTEAQATLMKSRTEAAVTAQLQREVGPNAGFAYGPARGAQQWARQSGRAVGPAGRPGGYGPAAMGGAGWQDGAPGARNCDPQFMQNRMGRR